MIEIMPETTFTPLELIGKCAGVCRAGADTQSHEANIKRAIGCIESGHGRALEFVDVYLHISGYSARVIREWYTHIGGAPTRLQESTRYANCEECEFTLPKNLAPRQFAAFESAMCNARTQYARLVELGIPLEDAALVLPLGMHTAIVDKRNLRNLVDIFHQRACNRAYWEFRDLMAEIKEALSGYSSQWRRIADMLFVPKCVALGYCPETHSCGKAKR